MARKTRRDRDLLREAQRSPASQLLEGAVSDADHVLSPPAPPPVGVPHTVLLPPITIRQTRSSTAAARAAQKPGAHQEQVAQASSMSLLLEITAISPCTPAATSRSERSTQPVTTNSSTTPGEAPWEKVLWKQQAYPDNHVDSSFLQKLVVNLRVPTRQYTAVLLDVVAVSEQLSLVAAAVMMPIHLKAGRLTATQLLLLDACLLLLGYAVCAVLGGHLLGGSLVRGCRQGVLLVGGVYLLSPLLKTLAATISEDSVVALTVIALLHHLFLHDYYFVNSVTHKLSGTVSLAAAALSAVLVASMMPSELHVTAQVLFSLELFLLSPFVQRYIRMASITAHICCAVLLAVVSALLCLPVSSTVAAVYVCAQLVLTFCCPAVLVRTHKYKAKINGPWDIAAPNMPTQLHMPAPAPAAEATAIAGTRA